MITERAPAALLEVDHLGLTRGGRTILDVERLVVATAGLLVIHGDAGSGKTALAASLAGTVPTSGSIRVGGREVSGPASRRRSFGLAAAVRDGARISGCTVQEALAVAAGRTGRAAEALDRFAQLAERRAVAAQVLSGGEQQLLQVACAWCAQPRVLILDSPTVGLAADAAAAVGRLANDEVDRGAVVIWLDQAEAAAPAAARWQLVRGSLSPVGTGALSVGPGSAAGSPPGRVAGTFP